MRKAIARGIFFAASLVITLLLLLFQQYDILDWRLLWFQSFVGLPILFLIIFIVIVIGSIFGFVTYQNQKSQVRIINEKLNQVLTGKTDTNLLDTEKNQLINQTLELISELQLQLGQITKRMQAVISEQLEDQEEKIEARLTEERNRLARELHDSVSQELFAASMLVSAINELALESVDQIAQPLEQVEQMIQQAQLEMRALLLHLRPIALKDQSLKAGIDQLISELVEKVPLKINWQTEEISLNRAVEDNLFRILQESLSNALRHAKANQINVLFIKRDHIAILTVIDDGIGFDPDQALSGSYGLANMQERTTEMGGQFKIVSLPNQGTKITVHVPLNREE
ncbi:sensor histidine kinase [Amphibacillus indicireducens]|uniref:Sensor histidine kinase n=1 Tax=Amphibacillus indicireducens TaxID=1076330 RepID=A0ABP7VZC2_9BACI